MARSISSGAGIAIGLLLLGLAAVPAAASGPARTGSVTCGANGTATFHRVLQFSAGTRPDKDGKVTLRTPATSCSGTQTGGNPHRPGPVDHGTFVANGQSTGHTCSDLTAHGLHAVKTTSTWFDATGTNLGVTKVASGTVTVSGLGNGVPSNFPPPNTPSPGIITMTLTGTAQASSTAFPGATVHATFVADRTVDSFPIPCSTFGAPLPPGIKQLAFSGVQGPSTISVG
jgi:hypothetical protein